jgi:hypothetical protein
MKRFVCFSALIFVIAGFLSAASITVTKPAAGDPWHKGSTYTIIWTMSGTMPATVRITLHNATTGAVTPIQDPAPNSGSYSWTIPTDIPDGSYKVRVKVKGAAVEGDSGAFNISAGLIQIPLHASELSKAIVAFKLPALSISGAALVVYEDSYRITFSYKNSGTGNLPKNSDMPVKPTFRVLVDGQVLNQGNLVIPAFEAAPGWEMPSFYGGEIKLPTSAEWDDNWTIGNTLVIYINENKVNGMASDTKTYDLKKLALGYAFDASIAGAAYIWTTESLTITVHIDGEFGTAKKFRLFSSGSTNIYVDKGLGGFLEEYDLVPGKRDYLVTHKAPLASESFNFLDTWIGAFLLKPTDNYPDQHDIDHSNNIKLYHFHR